MGNKVCMLQTSHCAKDDRIFYKEARSLSAHGFEVHILCVVEKDGFARDLGGKVINASGEDIFESDSITFHTVKKTGKSSEVYLKKIFQAAFQKNFISKGIEIDADVYHAHEPESLYLGYQISKKVKKSSLLLDAHESWINRGLKNDYIRDQIIPKLEYLISANQITRGYLLSLNYQLKTEVIYNSSVFRHNVNLIKKNNVLKIVHEGTLNFNRGLKTILESAKILKQEGAHFEIHLIGHIPEAENSYLKEYISFNLLEEEIVIRGLFPYEELPDVLKGFDLGIVTSSLTSNNYLAGPANKLFNYLSAGYPVLAFDLPETSRIIRKYSVGEVLAESNANELAQKIIQFIAKPDILRTYSENLMKYQDEFSWTKDSKKLIDFYETYLIARNKN